MTRDEIMEKVNEIFQEIFDDDELVIDETTNSEDIEDWDSLEQINILVAIQDEFDITFSLDDVSDLQTVGDTIDLIERKIR